MVILNIDTYGGLLTSGLEISRFIKRQDDLHTVAYIRDKAISAGSMIAMACDEIVMSDSASLGDCAPIIFGPGGLEAMPAAERAKIAGDAVTSDGEEWESSFVILAPSRPPPAPTREARWFRHSAAANATRRNHPPAIDIQRH